MIDVAVFDIFKDDNKIASGTVNECAEQLECLPSSIYTIIARTKKGVGNFRAVEVGKRTVMHPRSAKKTVRIIDDMIEVLMRERCPQEFGYPVECTADNCEKCWKSRIDKIDHGWDD